MSVCGICLDPATEDPVDLRCSHTFHRDCIRLWFERQQTCPVCRARTPPDGRWMYQVIMLATLVVVAPDYFLDYLNGPCHPDTPAAAP